MSAIRRVSILAVLAAGSAGCLPQSFLNGDERAATWPKDWSRFLGQTITVEGTAADAKLGALLLGDSEEIWIDGLEEWPEGFYRGGNEGKRIRVTGTVIARDDLPVFVQTEGIPAKAGIPVASEEQLKNAKRRFLLRDAKWTVLD